MFKEITSMLRGSVQHPRKIWTFLIRLPRMVNFLKYLSASRVSTEFGIGHKVDLSVKFSYFSTYSNQVLKNIQNRHNMTITTTSYTVNTINQMIGIKR